MTLTVPVEPAEAASATNAVKRAAIYLRVSSSAQVNTDYDPEGLSIPAQRQACQRYAERLDATVVREYVEPGVSGGSLLKRPAFRRMIEEISQQRDIDLVIVWSVSRWARNQEDHWVARGLITKAGAKLLSVKEPIGEESSHGILLEGVMAAAAAARRIEISEEVKRGIKRKIEVGGTNGLAPIGYLNVREPLPQGGEVRTVASDPERAPIVQWAYEAYATGLYSLADIALLLEARGLRSRPTARRRAQALTITRVHKLLSNPYYAGYVTHNGRVYQGRHEALITQDLFDKVQAVLASHRHSGERDRKHQHYLKGTIRCATCGSQLIYSQNKGNGGTYEYFICPKRQRGECQQAYQPVDLVEQAIENHYATGALSQDERQQVRDAITKDLNDRIELAQREVDRCRGVLAQLKERERKLLHMHYENRVSDELFDEEQAQLRQERKEAETLIGRLSINYQDAITTLDAALIILDEDLHELYRRAGDTVRRLINQAIFKALYILDQEVASAEYAEPFARLRTIQSRICDAPISKPQRRVLAPTRGQALFRFGSISTDLVRSSGLEPPRAAKPTRPSTSYTRTRCLQERPNRPNSALSRTHRTHIEERVLPRCRHADGASWAQLPVPFEPVCSCGPSRRALQSRDCLRPGWARGDPRSWLSLVQVKHHRARVLEEIRARVVDDGGFRSRCPGRSRADRGVPVRIGVAAGRLGRRCAAGLGATSHRSPARPPLPGLRGEAERRVAIGHEHMGISDHAVAPTADADQEIEHTARKATGEQDREPGGDHDYQRGDIQEDKRYVVRDGEHPLDQRKPAIEVVAGVRIGELEMDPLVLIG